MTLVASRNIDSSQGGKRKRQKQYKEQFALQGPGACTWADLKEMSTRVCQWKDDHGRAARHLRQHAGRVAFLACGPLSLRGSK